MAAATAAAEARDTSSELPSSKLGTQEYWDSVYQREVSNFASDGDRGEVWFGQEAAKSMLEYLRSHYSASSSATSSSSSPTILDVGTGNGHLLFSLCGVKDDEDESDESDEDEDDDEEKLDGKDGSGARSSRNQLITSPDYMCGCDYSAASVQLCKDIAASVQGSTQAEVGKIRWEECDVLKDGDVKQLKEMAGRIRGEESSRDGWDIVLDKGTLDAIALASSAPSAGTTPLNTYLSALGTLTTPGGLFLITSCNFTAEELVAKLTQPRAQAQVDQTGSGPATAAFEHLETLPAKRQFMFGGKKGSTTVCVAFRRLRE
ncbi:hypothetical protein BCV69DRAFT_285023 [Microstroma glucosiphilum]|uniref:Protein-lysine N-methyltransferase EFM4 n=1 Tax=Pseudomicrostroma glucosiphilum TaxID=1684307 RepID=A0A316U0L5_9BASI|nr:hypothetical protein BCV69DRAFT_285023 [Pseudomicrostroma glucosiphilum]PWN18398.1 hypothetical protein BCV69DRAFT_285023 [Pseudomicrostroma glucosiphilum]